VCIRLYLVDAVLMLLRSPFWFLRTFQNCFILSPCNKGLQFNSAMLQFVRCPSADPISLDQERQKLIVDNRPENIPDGLLIVDIRISIIH
jgi:hypothetical protein